MKNKLFAIKLVAKIKYVTLVFYNLEHRRSLRRTVKQSQAKFKPKPDNRTDRQLDRQLDLK